MPKISTQDGKTVCGELLTLEKIEKREEEEQVAFMDLLDKHILMGKEDNRVSPPRVIHYRVVGIKDRKQTTCSCPILNQNGGD